MMVRWGWHMGGGKKKSGTELLCPWDFNLLHEGTARGLDSLNGEEAALLRAICYQRTAKCTPHSAELASSYQLSAPVLLNYLSWEGSVFCGSHNHHFPPSASHPFLD